MWNLIPEQKFSKLWNKDLTIPVPALDIVIFTIYKWEVCVVLLKRDNWEWETVYALPWGIIAAWFSLEDNFDSILERKTWITWVYKEQIYTFWDPKRDKRWHTLSIVYLALLWVEKFLSKVDFTKVEIAKYSEIDKLKFWFDHLNIIKYTKQRLRWKMEYTNIAKDMLSDEFRISQLQEVYEIVLGKKIDKRNFQKKIFKLNMIKETWNLDKSTNRPAKLYSFVDKQIKIYEVI